MLAKTNRIVAPADFRHAMRKGKRVATKHTIIHITKNTGVPTRFGFIITKVVGNAVHRNLVKRRLRDISAEVIAEFPEGYSVVIRSLAGAENLTWVELSAEVKPALVKAMKKL